MDKILRLIKYLNAYCCFSMLASAFGIRVRIPRVVKNATYQGAISLYACTNHKAELYWTFPLLMLTWIAKSCPDPLNYSYLFQSSALSKQLSYHSSFRISALKILLAIDQL